MLKYPNNYLRKRLLQENPEADNADLTRLKEQLIRDLAAHKLTEPVIQKIVKEVMEDTIHFQLNPLKPLSIYYLDLKTLRQGLSPQDQAMYHSPEIRIILDRRDWQFSAVTGDCLGSGIGLD